MNVEIYMSLMKVYGWDNRRQDSLRRKSCEDEEIIRK